MLQQTFSIVAVAMKVPSPYTLNPYYFQIPAHLYSVLYVVEEPAMLLTCI